MEWTRFHPRCTVKVQGGHYLAIIHSSSIILQINSSQSRHQHSYRLIRLASKFRSPLIPERRILFMFGIIVHPELKRTCCVFWVAGEIFPLTELHERFGPTSKKREKKSLKHFEHQINFNSPLENVLSTTPCFLCSSDKFFTQLMRSVFGSFPFFRHISDQRMSCAHFQSYTSLNCFFVWSHLITHSEINYIK